MNLIMAIVGFVVLVWAVIPADAVAQEDRNGPNIVFILADDIGYGDLGCYGATKIRTPNLDRLASEGCRFTDAHSASAVCTPSRYGLMTGRYPSRENLWRPVFHTHGVVTAESTPTLSGMLQQAGYATACIGKWHLGLGDPAPDWNGDLKPGPLERGFDYFFGLPIVNSHPPFVYVENHRVLGLDPADPIRVGKQFKSDATENFTGKHNIGVAGGEAAHALFKDRETMKELTKRATDWLSTVPADKPYFLYFAPQAVHHPITPHPSFQGTSECGAYGDFVQELDARIGELLAAVSKHDRSDSTLVIFSSDNGGMFHESTLAAYNLGHRINGALLGHKFSVYEGGHRVPLVARWKDRIRPGTESDSLISLIDMMPTLAKLVGIPLPEGAAVDAVDQSSVLLGEATAPARRELILCPFSKKHQALRSDNWVYVPAAGPGGFENEPKSIHLAGQSSSDYGPDGLKRDAPNEQLFDLAADPKQSRNVVAEFPAIAKELRQRLKRLQSQWQKEPSKADLR